VLSPYHGASSFTQDKSDTQSQKMCLRGALTERHTHTHTNTLLQTANYKLVCKSMRHCCVSPPSPLQHAGAIRKINDCSTSPCVVVEWRRKDKLFSNQRNRKSTHTHTHDLWGLSIMIFILSYIATFVRTSGPHNAGHTHTRVFMFYGDSP